MIVDAHVHILAGAQFSSTYHREVGEVGDIDLDLLASQMDDLGVDKYVVLPQDMTRVWRSRITNEFVADYVKSHQDKTIGFTSAEVLDPLDRFNAPGLEEFERGIRELGLRGLLLTPPYGHYRPDDPAAYPFYQKAVELDVPVYFHQSAQGGPPVLAPLQYADPSLIDRVAMDFPDLRICIEHMGYPWTEQLLAIMAHAPNVYTDVSALFDRPYILARNLLMAKEYRVSNRVMYGSDYWYRADQASWEEQIRKEHRWLKTGLNQLAADSGWPEFDYTEINGILGENAVRFHRL